MKIWNKNNLYNRRDNIILTTGIQNLKFKFHLLTIIILFSLYFYLNKHKFAFCKKNSNQLKML